MLSNKIGDLYDWWFYKSLYRSIVDVKSVFFLATANFYWMTLLSRTLSEKWTRFLQLTFESLQSWSQNKLQNYCYLIKWTETLDIILIIKEILDHWMFITFLDTESFKKKVVVLVTSLTLNIFMIKNRFLEKKKWYPASQKKIWKNVY